MTQPTFLESVSMRMLALPTEQLAPILERIALELAARGESDAANYVRKAGTCLSPGAQAVRAFGQP